MSDSMRSDSTGPVGKIRWLIVGAAFVIAAIAYLDRSNISIAAPVLRQDLGLSDVQLGTIFSAFVIGYALAQPLAGRIADRFGPYKIIAIGIFWWSVLTAATAMVPATYAGAFATLLAVRFILGVGESVIFPASNRLVASWVPPQERGLANGIIFAGVGVGAAIAPPLITTIMIAQDWRWAFWITAFIGVGAMVLWLLFVRDTPQQHRWVREPEARHIQVRAASASPPSGRVFASWRSIIFNRNVAVLTLSYFCFGYVAYIFFSWFFTYLSAVRGLDLKSSGIYGMLPFIAMAIASPLGGWVSDRVSIRWGDRVGRCGIAGVAMALAGIFVALATEVQDVRVATFVLAAGSGALYIAQSAYWTLSANIGQSSAGSVAGVMNMGGQIGGAVVGILTPVLAAQFGWSGSFVFTAGVCIVGAVAWLFIDPSFTLPSEQAAEADDAARPAAAHG